MAAVEDYFVGFEAGEDVERREAGRGQGGAAYGAVEGEVVGFVGAEGGGDGGEGDA